MSSRSWFSLWWRSVLGLFSLGSKPRRLSKEQRQRRRERRLRSRYSSANLYRTKRKTRSRQSRQSAETGRTLNALLGFIFTSVACLVLLPFSLFRRVSKRAGRKRSIGSSSARKRSAGKQAAGKRGARKTAARATAKPSKTAKPSGNPTVSTPVTAYKLPPTDIPGTVDENAPKSKPRQEGDQYIQKRMVIAGSSYCDPAVLEKLTVGTYIELEAEFDNPYDRSAVKLTFEGEKVGYVPKNEQLSYATCLKLKRGVYGVITDVQADTSPTKYEFETWFSRP